MSTKNPRDVIIRPVVSEKSYASYDENVYTFVVAKDANKVEIKQAIEEIFNVKVTNVNTLNRNGKRKRNRRTGGWGQRVGQKRAIVSLAEGQTDRDLRELTPCPSASASPRAPVAASRPSRTSPKSHATSPRSRSPSPSRRPAGATRTVA